MQGRIQDFWIQDLGRGGGGNLRFTSKTRGARRGSNFRPNVKKPITWARGGGGSGTPWTPPGSAHYVW